MAWVKLHREETVAFGSLPVLTRGLAAELLKICDQKTGVLVKGADDWEGLVCMRLGAHPKERKAVRSALRQLVASGYIRETQAAVGICNFVYYQGKAMAPAEISHDVIEKTTTTCGSYANGSPMVVGRSSHDALNDGVKGAGILGFKTLEREEKKREEGGEATTRPTLAPHVASQPVFGYWEALEAANAARDEAGVGQVIHLSPDEMRSLGTFADRVAASHPDAPADRVRAAHAAWLATADDWTKRKGHPLSSWLKSPDGALLAKTAKPARKSEYRKLKDVL